MGSKIGTIISFIYVALFLLLGCDIMSVQYIYSDLDAKAVNISYIISKNGLSESTIGNIENNYNVSFTCLNNCNAAVGETVTYKISVNYKPIVISKNELTIFVSRQAVIGYFG